ncbi:MAG TPA: FAD/NAD(P)-binding protein [Geminicoccaceae bacterium]|nr:FAD/NAD(P)-binding protein [Geminicoccus sp.]HMU51469.1 FAD/NAD(P)-binding protein [Geminicoccaceae bacterium]
MWQTTGAPRAFDPAPTAATPYHAGSDRPCRIAVIGAGFSGALTAIHLLWHCRPGERVYLVEKSGRLGQGLAYATANPQHLLNVRASRMSAFEDEPDHFLRWLDQLPPAEREAAGVSTGAGIFVRRSVYGDYIQSLLRDAINRLGGARNLFIVTDSAVGLKPIDGGLDLETACGRCYGVDAAVLALGNFPPDNSDAPSQAGSPWDPQVLDRLDPGRPLLLLGTGLTMVDICIELLGRGFTGPIHAMSRRGQLPQPHAPAPTWSGLHLDAEDRRSVASLLRAVRRCVAEAREQGVGWRSVMDSLRPHIQLLWQEMSPADRHRFLRHLRPWWDSHRHRVAPTIARVLDGARAEGRLKVLAGRLERLEPDGAGIVAHWTQRGGVAGEPIAVQRVINCTGPGGDLTRVDDPLVQQLLRDGLARQDRWRLGLETSGAGAIVGHDGRPSARLFGVGPVTRGTFWEITSVPDIRQQAEQVALLALDAARRHAAGLAA